MEDYSQLYQQGLYLSPNQHDLLLAALSNTNQSQNRGNSITSTHTRTESSSTTSPQSRSNTFDMSPSAFFDSPGHDALGSGQMGFGGESPFPDFDPDAEFEFQDAEQLIGELPDATISEEPESREKRKSIDGDGEEVESGKKRRESEDKDKVVKRPGRKPLTSEPTSKRKAQNRAAQRAFRERKERHLHDLEVKVEELERASQSTHQENGQLRAEVERLQVEVKEYRKRLSWLASGSGSGLSTMNSLHSTSRNLSGITNNDFYFDFPKFGDLPGAHIFNNNGSLVKLSQNKSRENSSVSSAPKPSTSDFGIPGVLTVANSINANNAKTSNGANGPPRPSSDAHSNSFRPSSDNNSVLDLSTTGNPLTSTMNTSGYQHHAVGSSTVSNSDSPSSSSESHHGQTSSLGTSPEPCLNSPCGKPNDQGPEAREEKNHSIDGEKSFCEQLMLACGTVDDPVPAAIKQCTKSSQTQQYQTISTQSVSFDWLAQQNGGQFDPVLFSDYREPQDAILSQDFGTFFNDAFPSPDLGSPFQNLNDPPSSSAPKKDLVSEIDRRLDDDDEVVPGEDTSQMMTCTKIWDRLQSMEKFHNGQVDLDDLCTELRTKARCSESGPVINKKDVDAIIMERVQKK